MKEMRILVVRIYNSTPEYDMMRKIHMQNDNSIFVCYDENLDESWNYNESQRLITIKGKETILPGILTKTVKAIEICLKMFQFDILIRSNISTIINVNELEKQLSSYSTIYGGHPWVLDWHDWKYGIDQQALAKYRYTEFISGTSILLSRDNCEYIVNNKDKLDYSIVDDVAIGILMKEKQKPNFHSYFVQSKTLQPNICFYRFCTENNRLQDIEDMKTFYSNTKRGTICIASNS